MDPITQGLLGAAVGQAVYGRRLGRKAALYGGLVGMAPDLDIVLAATGPLGEIFWHRGPTHALAFGPVVGPILGWVLWRWRRGDGQRLRDWIGLAILALVTHPLLDIFTTYGTQIFAPFSTHRVSLDAASIVDPLYSLLLVLPFLLGRRLGWASVSLRRAAAAALLLSTAYLGLGMALDMKARQIARKEVIARGMTPVRVEAHPTVLQHWLRRLVVRTQTGWGIGWVSLWTGEVAEFQFFDEPRDARIERALQTREGRAFAWFANEEVTGRVVEKDGLERVDLVDLRYGMPGDPRVGLFTFEIDLDGAGTPTGVVRRTRRVPTGNGQGPNVLSQLFRASFLTGGLSQ